jgi:heat shock transcription factor, other eukaryote
MSLDGSNFCDVVLIVFLLLLM